MRTAFQDRGDIRATDVLAALVALWREGASGSLHFSRSGATAGFELIDGELVGVSSSESRFETASILLRAGKLEAATLERLPAPEGADRAQTALQAGVLTKREWRWGEKIRAVEVLSDLLTWIEGEYVFDRHDRPELKEFRLTIPRLVLELFLRSRDRGLVLHHLGGADVPLARAPRFEAEFSAFGLTADAEAVVGLIDGKTTAAQIASEGPADPFAVEKLLAALVTLGLVHPEFAGAEPARDHAAEEPDLAAEARGARLEDEPGEEAEEGPREEEAGEDEEAEASAAEEGSDAEDAELDAGIRDLPEFAEDVSVQDLEPAERDASGELELDAAEVGGRDGTDLDAVLEPGRARSGGPIELEPDAPMRTADVSMRPGEAAERRPTGASEPLIGRPLDLATGVGSMGRSKPRSSRPFLWLLVLLAAGVGLVILLRGRGPSPAAVAVAPGSTPTASEPSPAATLAASPAATALPAAVPTPMAIGPTAAARPSRPTPAPTRPARPAASPARPTAVPAPRAAAPTPRAAAPPSREAAPATRQGWIDRANRDRQRATTDRRAQFTIQLELACEVPSLVDAWKHDRPAGTMWVLTTPFDGRTCFRVLWGRYPTRDAAHKALSSAPAFFSTPRNRPVVTAIR